MTAFELLRRLYRVAWMAGLLAGLSATGPKPETTKACGPESDFTGKIILIQLKSRSGGAALENVQVRTLGGRSFLVGQVIDEGSGRNPIVGRTVWIAVDEVTEMWEYKDLDEVRESYRRTQGPATSNKPVELEEGVVEIRSRSFAMPIRIAGDRSGLARVRLYVSRDHGRTWQHEKDYEPSEEQMTFLAPEDGLYWFAVQVVYKGGRREPPTAGGLVPAQKLYVNSQRKTLKVRKANGEPPRGGERPHESAKPSENGAGAGPMHP